VDCKIESGLEGIGVAMESCVEERLGVVVVVGLVQGWDVLSHHSSMH